MIRIRRATDGMRSSRTCSPTGVTHSILLRPMTTLFITCCVKHSIDTREPRRRGDRLQRDSPDALGGRPPRGSEAGARGPWYLGEAFCQAETPAAVDLTPARNWWTVADYRDSAVQVGGLSYGSSWPCCRLDQVVWQLRTVHIGAPFCSTDVEHCRHEHCRRPGRRMDQQTLVRVRSGSNPRSRRARRVTNSFRRLPAPEVSSCRATRLPIGLLVSGCFCRY